MAEKYIGEEMSNYPQKPKPDPDKGDEKKVNTWSGGGTKTAAPTQAKLYNGQELADMFGFIFGQENIEAILNQATNAKFDELDASTRKNRDQSLTDYSNQFQQYRLENRNQQRNALKTGLSRGANIAQEVMGQLGAQQAGAQQQQQYQQNLADITQQRGSQLASDKFTAMNTQNEIAGQLGGMAINQQGNTVQENAAYQSYLGQMAQANAQHAMANAQRYSADQTKAYMDNQTNNASSQSSSLIAAAKAAGYPDVYAQMIGHGVDPKWVTEQWELEKAKAARNGTQPQVTQQPQVPQPSNTQKSVSTNTDPYFGY